MKAFIEGREIAFVVDLPLLAAPFEPKDVSWRVQRAGQSDAGKVWAAVVAYLDNRVIMDRLDAACGIGGWKNEYRYEQAASVLLCGLSVRIGGEWVTRWDGAPIGGTKELDIKGALSNAMKRAAVHWGIGRYLYHVRESFAIIASNDDRTARYQPAKESEGRKKGYPAFKWHPPQLPDWALPPKMKTPAEAAAKPAEKPAEERASGPTTPIATAAATEIARVVPAAAQWRLPGAKTNLDGYGGKRLIDVPLEKLPLIRDTLKEANAVRYKEEVDAIDEYLEAMRPD